MSEQGRKDPQHFFTLFSWAGALLVGLALSGPVAAAPPTTLDLLHRFKAADGIAPLGPLLQARDGAWYGTTARGGALGHGTIYRLGADGAFSVLHAFDDSLSGHQRQLIYSGLSEGPDGTLYGSVGGGNSRNSVGIVYSLSPAGVYSVLHTFSQTDPDPASGKLPFGPPKPASDGNLYGATLFGGTFNRGTVYRMTSGGAVGTLRSFDNASGGYPRNVIVGQDGALYGSTGSGPANMYSYGTVFRMTLAGDLTTLVTLPSDGRLGRYIGDLVQAADGRLYGVAQGEVVQSGGDLEGQIFSLGLDGDYRILHAFVHDGSEGEEPDSHLTLDANGVFWGCNANGGRYEGGTAFSMTADGTVALQYSFGGNRGQSNAALAHPVGGLTHAADGGLYGILPAMRTAGNRHGALFVLQPR